MKASTKYYNNEVSDRDDTEEDETEKQFINTNVFTNLILQDPNNMISLDVCTPVAVCNILKDITVKLITLD